MHICIFRQYEIDDATLGTLMVCNKDRILLQCSTLEPKIRDKKIKGSTAIPAGTYKIKYQYSSKFATTMPFLQDVPNFSGIMFHVGNTLKDTEGCILVGTHNEPSKAYIYNSRLTFNLLDALLKKYADSGVNVHIYDPYKD